jgi:hypothetical protein
MLEMGLSKFQGAVVHNQDWKPRWMWDTDHDHWNKGSLTNFRWSVIQPNSDKAGLSALSNYDPTPFKIGSDTIACGDCHDPTEPGYPSSLTAGFNALQGSLEIDRIQLVRRPQISGGTNVTITAIDTTTKK